MVDAVESTSVNEAHKQIHDISQMFAFTKKVFIRLRMARLRPFSQTLLSGEAPGKRRKRVICTGRIVGGKRHGLRLVTKAGGFGKKDTLAKIFRALKWNMEVEFHRDERSG